MKTQFTLALLVASGMGALTDQDKQECVSYFANHGKNENSNANFDNRCEAFAKNKAKFNAMNNNPNSKAKFGCNEFCDQTEAEFVNNHTGAQVPSEDAEQGNNNQKKKGRRGLQTGDLKPYYINWGETGEDKVHPVKFQGNCGSCWAIAAVTVQESMEAIKYGKPAVGLSEQEGVDCVETAYGCRGGWVTSYWDFSKTEGSMLNVDYPYQASTLACRNQELKNQELSGHKIASKVAEYYRVASDPLSIARALQDGPLTIAVQVDSCWIGYNSGILTENNDCYVGNSINHTLVLIGLGETDGVEHWTLRNSWSSAWADNGDIHIQVTDDGAGISNMMRWVYSLQVQDGYGPEFWGRKDECPIDESLNDLGPSECKFDEDCQGARTCSEGMCKGESGCSDDQAVSHEMLAVLASALQMENVPSEPSAAWWPTVLGYANQIANKADQLEKDLEEALKQAFENNTTPVPEGWAKLYFTTDKLGWVQPEPAIFDDIEVLKVLTPNTLPRIVSIEVLYNNWHVSGYKVNYDFIETEEYSAHDGEIYAQITEVFELAEDDYIVEMGARSSHTLFAFWFKTKNGHEAFYGDATNGNYEACDTSAANKPMIIGFGMRDHVEIEGWGVSMQSLWCHVVDLDDFP